MSEGVRARCEDILSYDGTNCDEADQQFANGRWHVNLVFLYAPEALEATLSNAWDPPMGEVVQYFIAWDISSVFSHSAFRRVVLKNV